MGTVRVAGINVQTSEVLLDYWRFAAERQRVYTARVRREPAPWTNDPIISRFRFTNAYRAADRVSQELIRVIYSGPQGPLDILLRTLLFRFFNKPATWYYLEDSVGQVNADSFDTALFDSLLNRRLAERQRIYSAAYIVPPPPFGAIRKHKNHLLLIEHMLASDLCESLQEAKSLESVYQTLLSFPSIGPFLAYQLAIDLNYSVLLDFNENDFVVPGPGARSGISKCFPAYDGLRPEDLIHWMVDTQQDQLDQQGLVFADLFGRSLSLIDCQNLFCEIDKYSRVARPEIKGQGKRSKIKQNYAGGDSLAPPFFPPKWGINDRAEEAWGVGAKSDRFAERNARALTSQSE